MALSAPWLTLRWRITGVGALVVPPFAGRRRSDGLWRTTCFELFVQSEGADSYCEFNFSPSEAWAAYDFTAYRTGMAERVLPRPPVCSLRGHGDMRIFDVALPTGALPPLPARIGIAAVIAEADGAVSHWALAHPPGKPDFHDPVGRALPLAAGV